MPSKMLTEWHAFFEWRQEQRETAERQAKDAADGSQRARQQAGMPR